MLKLMAVEQEWQQGLVASCINGQRWQGPLMCDRCEEVANCEEGAVRPVQQVGMCSPCQLAQYNSQRYWLAQPVVA